MRSARETLDRTGTLDRIGSDNVFEATDRVRQSVLEAQVEAEQRLAARP
jgi:hypothetical protein